MVNLDEEGDKRRGEPKTKRRKYLCGNSDYHFGDFTLISPIIFIFFSFHNVSFVISATLLSCSVHNFHFRKRELKLLQLVLEIMRNSKDNWKKLQEKTFTP